MTDHLAMTKVSSRRSQSAGTRSGTSPKTVLTAVSPVTLAVPRDLAGKCAPQTVPEHARRSDGVYEAIVSLYAKRA
jgi:putative transposase